MRTEQPVTLLTGWQRLAEAALVIFTLVSAFLMLALVSYNPNDPGWSQTAWQKDIANLAGAAGAWFADLFFFLFGKFSYLLPFLIVLLGWAILWRPRHLLRVNYFTLGVKLMGFTTMILGMAGVASINFDDFHHFSAGGLIGDIVMTLAIPLLGRVGANLVLLAAVGAGIPLFTGWSWLMITEQIGKTLSGIFAFIFSIPARLSGRYQPPLPEEEYEDEEFFDDEEFDTPPDDLFDDEERAPPLPVKPNAVAPKLNPTVSVQPKPNQPPMMVEEPEDEDLFLFEPVTAASSKERVEPSVDLFDLEEPMPSAPPVRSYPKNVIVTEPKVAPVAAATPTPPQSKPMEQPLWTLPSLDLLDAPVAHSQGMSRQEQERMARLVESKLADYNVQARVVGVYPGPVITRFELDLAPGMKAAKITNLSRDIARSLSASSVRVVEVIPGKSYIGLELPNPSRQVVRIREVLSAEAFQDNPLQLPLALGQDISGEAVVVDLTKMPHLLVAGTTGSGKSVGVNSMLLSLLYHCTPAELRMILIDPKMLELSVYEGVPHLLTPVVTDMNDAANALRWCVREMERRYKLLAGVGVRNLKSYNAKVEQAEAAGQPLYDPAWRPNAGMGITPQRLETLPQIVVVVDEFADLMMTVGKKVEELITRIAQKARAAGIHLILATQRPSVDVITGLIKANIPTRISFQVSSKVDSRTILDQGGAESLLGMGDMLYLPAGSSDPYRVHGAFVSDDEVHRVVEAWQSWGAPDYLNAILDDENEAGAEANSSQELDPLFDEAVAFIVQSRRGSTSSLQRRFKIGYNRAARIMEQMEQEGIVSTVSGNGQREVLAPEPIH